MKARPPCLCDGNGLSTPQCHKFKKLNKSADCPAYHQDLEAALPSNLRQQPGSQPEEAFARLPPPVAGLTAFREPEPPNPPKPVRPVGHVGHVGQAEPVEQPKRESPNDDANRKDVPLGFFQGNPSFVPVQELYQRWQWTQSTFMPLPYLGPVYCPPQISSQLLYGLPSGLPAEFPFRSRTLPCPHASPKTLDSASPWPSYSTSFNGLS